MLPLKTTLLGVGAAVLISAVAAWHYTAIKTAKSQVHAHYAEILRDISEKTATAAAEYRKTEQTWNALIQKEATDGQKRLNQAVADATAANLESRRLRIAYRNSITAALTAKVTGAPSAGSSDSGARALDLLSNMFTGVDEAAGTLAEYADKVYASGLTCERISDGLGGQ